MQLKPQPRQEEGEVAGNGTAAVESTDGLQFRYRLCGVVPNARSVAVFCPRSSSVAEGENPVPNADESVWFLVEFNRFGASTRVSFMPTSPYFEVGMVADVSKDSVRRRGALPSSLLARRHARVHHR
jgi:hypothetical protein